MSYIRYFKNKSGATKIYFGVEFANNEIKQIPDGKLQGFAVNDTVLADLASGNAIMSQDGSTEYSADIATQIAFLQGGLPTKVQTEFEQNDMVPKFATGVSSFVSNVATIKIKCPGTPGVTGRYLIDGYCFTDAFYFGDRISKVQVTDEDDLLGGGAGTVLKTYHDADLPTANQGWMLWAEPSGTGGCDLDNAGGFADFPAGMYLYVEITKEALSTATKAGVNIFWCDKE